MTKVSFTLELVARCCDLFQARRPWRYPERECMMRGFDYGLLGQSRDLGQVGFRLSMTPRPEER